MDSLMDSPSVEKFLKSHSCLGPEISKNEQLNVWNANSALITNIHLKAQVRQKQFRGNNKFAFIPGPRYTSWLIKIPCLATNWRFCSLGFKHRHSN